MRPNNLEALTESSKLCLIFTDDMIQERDSHVDKVIFSHYSEGASALYFCPPAAQGLSGSVAISLAILTLVHRFDQR